MSNERLQDIADNLHLQIIGEKGMGYIRHSSLLQEKIDLFNEVVRLKTELAGTTHCYDETELNAFKKKLKDIVEYCRTTQMSFEEFLELERIANNERI